MVIILINPVNLINTYKNYGSKPVTVKSNYGLEKDTVSFSGKSAVSKTEAIETIDKAVPLSNAGFKGVVYKLDKDGKNYAIKVARSPEYKFDNEANILKQVPEDINCQRFVSYFQHPKTNCDVLVSTFVDGKKSNLKTTDEFNQFFDMLLKLDKANVLHGDLNMQNCLFGSKGIGLIDFGEGEVFKTGATYDDYIYPEFVLKSNVVNLEHNGIPDCIQSWVNDDVDPKECFKDYLISKSKYYQKHADFLTTQRQSPSAIEFEQNYSKVLSNPSKLVIENEIRRIDCLYTFEHADTAVNYKKIPNAAIKIWNMTIQKVKNQLDFIDNVLNYADLSNDERKYFEYQKDMITMFNEQFTNWGASTIEWLNGLSVRNDLSEYEKKFIENKNEQMSMPPNLVNMVLGDV